MIMAETGPIARIRSHGKDTAITSTCVSAYEVIDRYFQYCDYSWFAEVMGPLRPQAKNARLFEVEYKQYVVTRVMLQSTE